MKVKPSNGLNLILPADVTLYPNSNHTFIGCQQPAQSCVVCREPNGIFISIKIDKTLRKCECQPVIHLECFRKYADPHWFSEEIAIPCLSCNGPTLIRSTRDVILTAVYNMTGCDDESWTGSSRSGGNCTSNLGIPWPTIYTSWSWPRGYAVTRPG